MSAHLRTSPAASPRQVARERRRRRLLPLVLALVTALLLGWSAWRGGEDAPDPELTAGTRPAAPAADPLPSPRGSASTSPSPTPAAVSSPPTTPGQVTPVLVEVPAAGTGELVRVPVGIAAGEGSGRLVRYGVEVEGGLPFDVGEFARQVHTILTDAQGWQPVLGVRFELVAEGDVELRVTLASPARTDALCAPANTNGNLSCWNGSQSVINAKRWGIGAESYGDAVVPYRYYLIAHEVGHGLGRSHRTCPSPGAPAPVMVQQSKSLYGCAANPYPAVTGG